MLLTLWVSSVLIFVASDMVPVDVGRNILGQFAPQEAVDALNEQLGMNDPAVMRYGNWLERTLRGDLGLSTSQQLPVAHLLAQRGLNSAILAALALVVIMPLALLLGVIAALQEGQVVDRAISFSTLVATSTPEFVTGVLLLLLFAVHLHWLPASSALIGGATPLARPDKLVLPVLTLALVDIGYVARMMRASMVEAMRSPHVRAARLRGLPYGHVVLGHALRGALVTPLTVVLLHINWLLGGIVVTETIYGYPGLGQLLLTAAHGRDLPLLQAGALLLAIVAVLSQILADLLQAWLDPRSRAAVR